MTDVLILAEAEEEYTASLTWYAERSLTAALGFEGEFERVLVAIADAPQCYPFCDGEHRFYLMRRYPFHVIYRTLRNDVVVVAVAHTSRSPGYWANR